MSKSIVKKSGPMPRLPSFQQLNDTIKDSSINTKDIDQNQNHNSNQNSNQNQNQKILNYSSAFKNLALYQESQSSSSNNIKNELIQGEPLLPLLPGSSSSAAAQSKQEQHQQQQLQEQELTKQDNQQQQQQQQIQELHQPLQQPPPIQQGNNLLGPEYSYGTSLYDRHESFPNQFFSINGKNDLMKTYSISTSPVSIDSMYSQNNSNVVKNDTGNSSSDENYEFISNLIQFLTKFDSKVKEVSVLSYYSHENYEQIMRNVIKGMKNENVCELLFNFKKIVELLENIQAKYPLEHPHRHHNHHNHHNNNNHHHNSNHHFTHNGTSSNYDHNHTNGESLKRSMSHQSLPINVKRNRKKLLNGITLNENGVRLLPDDFDHSSNPILSSNDFNGSSSSRHNMNSSNNGYDDIKSSFYNNNKPLVTCQHCLSQETPEWRRGPEGSRTLCNACGLFYSKLIKKFGLRGADKVMLERKQSGAVNDRRIL
ncbi:uncharacterized protein KGF55_003072 [Candida pseudojiufengensis]|uniref:uncharacterized protein n=1 Tax=Candida pseudojiufengensis TaxID=497109 RepID=UPI002225968F|nr:uncharacterized protein KGF55_003072 [Candida pseudojiufengensis]KAI5963280.1 hypothetical protein KGF55_003072 [Candida pseudojiufengensis]